jgi:hypothetical protein
VGVVVWYAAQEPLLCDMVHSSRLPGRLQLSACTRLRARLFQKTKRLEDALRLIELEEFRERAGAAVNIKVFATRSGVKWAV